MDTDNCEVSLKLSSIKQTPNQPNECDYSIHALTGQSETAVHTMTKLYPDQSSTKPTGQRGSKVDWLCTASTGFREKQTTHL